ETPPAGLTRRGQDRLATLPDQVPAEERDEEAVRVIGIVPPIANEIGQDLRVEEAEQRREDENDGDGRRDRRAAWESELCRRGVHSAHMRFAARTIIHIRKWSNIPTVLRSYIHRGSNVRSMRPHASSSFHDAGDDDARSFASSLADDRGGDGLRDRHGPGRRE